MPLATPICIIIHRLLLFAYAHDHDPVGRRGRHVLARPDVPKGQQKTRLRKNEHSAASRRPDGGWRDAPCSKWAAQRQANLFHGTFHGRQTNDGLKENKGSGRAAIGQAAAAQEAAMRSEKRQCWPSCLYVGHECAGLFFSGDCFRSSTMALATCSSYCTSYKCRTPYNK